MNPFSTSRAAEITLPARFKNLTLESTPCPIPTIF